MSAFKRTRAERYASASHGGGGGTDEGRYWGKLKACFQCELSSGVADLAFAPGEARGHDGAPVYRLAVAAGLDVHVFGCKASRGRNDAPPSRKGVGRFKAVANSVAWRADGRLLACGDANGAVHLVDAHSGAGLRRLEKGHDKGAPCADACWGAGGAVASVGGDGSVVLWDVATGKAARKVKRAHDDAATAIISLEGGLYATAGYDGYARLWDLRQAGGCARAFAHGTRVECLAAVPGTNAFASGGGHDVVLWDALDERPTHRFADAHAKSATAVVVDTCGVRLLSCGLDGLVKAHSLVSHATTAAPARYGVGCAGLAVCGGRDAAGANRILAVGTVAGLVDARARDVSAKHDDRRKTLAPPPGTFRHFSRGKAFSPSAGDCVVVDGGRSTKAPKLARHDECLRKFRYGDALDEALRTRDPGVVVAVLADLARRGGVRAALKNRSDTRLEPLLAFLAQNVAKPRYAAALVDVAASLLEIYGRDLGARPAADDLFAAVERAALTEVDHQTTLLGLSGALDALLAQHDLRASRAAEAAAAAP